MSIREGKLYRRTLAALVAALSLGLLLIGAQGASAAPIGADGTVNACYVAKGKKRGTIRLVKPDKTCKQKRGEKPILWSVAGPAGPQGASGAGGPVGPQGAPGADANTQELLDLLDDQALQIQALTDQLGGVSDQVGTLTDELGDVTDQVGDVTDQVGALTATANDACAQITAQNVQLNAVRSAVAGLGLNSVLNLLGGALNIPALPPALAPFACLALN